MGIIGQFARSLSNITRFLRSPFAGLRTMYSSFTYPVRMLRSSLGQIRRFNPRRYMRLPAPLRQLQNVTANFARQFPITKKFVIQREQQKQEREIAEVEGEAFHIEQRKTEYSQVHLVNHRTKKRAIGHIGTEIGRSETEFQLSAETYLIFLRVNSKIYQAPLLMQAQSKVPILVDGEELAPDGEDSLPVRQGSIIKAGSAEWQVELFAWDELPTRTRVNAAWATHIGPLHDHNEDAIGIYQHAAGYLFAIGDGVGGVSLGEVASEFTIQYLISAVSENMRYGFDWHDVLRDAVTVINHMIRKKTELSGLISSAVLTAVVIQNWDVFILHIGDTRLYHYGKDGLHRVTREHMIMIEQPGLNPGEIVLHPVLSRAIGKDDLIQPDLLLLRLHPGDRLLLASDGILSVTDAELADIMMREPIEMVPEKLMSLAYRQGSNDNVSIIAIEALPESAAFDRWQATASPRVYVQAEQEIEFDTDQELKTTVPTTTSSIFVWLLLVVLICGLSVMGYSRMKTVPDATPTATAHVTRVFAVTQLPSPMPIIIATSTPSSTPVPPEPTSTLRPVPTSTLDSPGR